MRRVVAIFGLAAVTALATGCGASVETPAATSQILEPDATGWVDRSKTGTTGIQGQWHAFADSRFGAPASDCQTDAYGECSIVREPAPGARYAPTAGAGMCTSGIIARWIAGSVGLTPDLSPGWAGIVLELNMMDWPAQGASGAPPAGSSYDALAHGVTGLAFEIDSEPAPGAGLLVTIAGPAPLPDSKPLYWGGNDMDASPVHAGHNEFAWSDVGPGSLDGARLLRVGFLIAGNDSRAVTYSFCINHLTALRSPGHMTPRSAFDDQPLVPDGEGWVDRATTGTTNIQGLWVAVADGVSGKPVPPGACLMAGYADTDCSAVREPDPAADNYAPTKDLGMCTSGVVGRAVAGSDGFTPVWGAEIVFILNAADPGGLGADVYDAVRYGVTGFAFDIDSEPSPGAEILVELATPQTVGSQAYWGGRAASWSPVHAGHNEFRWEDVGGPAWAVNPPRLDRKNLTQIGFHVPSNQTHAVTYSFCINHLTALRH